MVQMLKNIDVRKPTEKENNNNKDDVCLKKIKKLKRCQQ